MITPSISRNSSCPEVAKEAVGPIAIRSPTTNAPEPSPRLCTGICSSVASFPVAVAAEIVVEGPFD